MIGPAWAVPMDVGGRFSGTVTGVMNMAGALAASFTPIVYGTLFGRGYWVAPFLVSAAVKAAGALIWMFLIDPEKSVSAEVSMRCTVTPSSGTSCTRRRHPAVRCGLVGIADGAADRNFNGRCSRRRRPSPWSPHVAARLGGSCHQRKAGQPRRSLHVQASIDGDPTGCVSGQCRHRGLHRRQGMGGTGPVADGPFAVDLYNDCTMAGDNLEWEKQLDEVVIDKDGVEITGFIFADNFYELRRTGGSWHVIRSG